MPGCKTIRTNTEHRRLLLNICNVLNLIEREDQRRQKHTIYLSISHRLLFRKMNQSDTYTH